MNRGELLNELISNTWVMIKPSPIEGIGVFALQDIPKGCRSMFSKATADEQWITISKTEVENLPEHAKALIENYCLYDADNYFVPDYGFKKIDLVIFLNHSRVQSNSPHHTGSNFLLMLLHVPVNFQLLFSKY